MKFVDHLKGIGKAILFLSGFVFTVLIVSGIVFILSNYCLPLIEGIGIFLVCILLPGFIIESVKYFFMTLMKAFDE